MPNFLKTQNLVQRYLSTRVPSVMIQSIEPTRAMSLTTERANHMCALTFFEHLLSSGIRGLLIRQLHSEDASLVLAMEQARPMFKSRASANLIFTDMEDLDQGSSMSRHFTELVRLAELRQGIIILISSSPVWTGLSRLGMSAALKLPSRDEMHPVVVGMTDDHRQVVQIEWGDTEVTRTTEILAGITRMEAINVVVSLVAKGAMRNEGLSELSSFKDRIFGGLSGVERIPLWEDFTVDGLGNLKGWL